MRATETGARRGRLAFQSFKLCSPRGADLDLYISKCVGGLQMLPKLPVSQETVFFFFLFFPVLLTLWREKKEVLLQNPFWNGKEDLRRLTFKLVM